MALCRVLFHSHRGEDRNFGGRCCNTGAVWLRSHAHSPARIWPIFGPTTKYPILARSTLLGGIRACNLGEHSLSQILGPLDLLGSLILSVTLPRGTPDQLYAGTRIPFLVLHLSARQGTGARKFTAPQARSTCRCYLDPICQRWASIKGVDDLTRNPAYQRYNSQAASSVLRYPRRSWNTLGASVSGCSNIFTHGDSRCGGAVDRSSSFGRKAGGCPSAPVSGPLFSELKST
jgi:hypothetical protein